jgi:hypothetical protein
MLLTLDYSLVLILQQPACSCARGGYGLRVSNVQKPVEGGHSGKEKLYDITRADWNNSTREGWCKLGSSSMLYPS